MLTESRISDTALPAAPESVPARSIVVDDAVRQQVYELVRTRVLESIGVGGNWTVDFRRGSDTDSFFSDTMADMIAWDVVARLTPPMVPNRARLVS